MAARCDDRTRGDARGLAVALDRGNLVHVAGESLPGPGVYFASVSNVIAPPTMRTPRDRAASTTA